jgi:cell division protein FtsW
MISINDLKVDSVLLLSILILIMTGLITLSSASSAISENNFGTPFYYLNRQLIAIFIGSIFAMICLYVPIFYWERMGPFLLIVGLLLLLLVLLPGFGHTVNGSTRWL